MRSVRVEWEGPFCLDYVIEELNRKDDYGLYQIYGTHIVYGASSLLYIGKAEGLTFSQRFSQHRSEWLSDWREVLRDAEALTIYWHSPAYNSSNIETYNGQQLKVANRGDRGALCAEYIK